MIRYQSAFMSATRRLVATIAMMSLALSASAATVLNLKGDSNQTRSADDAELRLSLLGYNDEASAREFSQHLREYLTNQNHETFEKFIREQQTRGYVFSKEATGYTIKYAWQDPQAKDQHMVFVVTPALKTLNPYLWKTKNTALAPFSVLELRFDGEAATLKTSLDASVEVTADGRVQLQDYDKAEPFAVLKDNTPYYLKGGQS